MTQEDIEVPDEEPTPAEIADACRRVLDAEICDEIAAQENVGDALGLAFTALGEVGQDPDEILGAFISG